MEHGPTNERWLDRDGEIEVFATGATVARRPDTFPVETESHDITAGSMTARMRRRGVAVRDGFDHALEFHARPGHRPGGPPIPTASGRLGGDADVVRPVLIDPLLACRLAETGSLFSEPVPHLRIESPGDLRSQRYLAWDAVVSDGRYSHRATLHLLASPSMVVTILELVPKRRIGRHRDRYLREGIAAIDVLAHRLERSAPAPSISEPCRHGVCS